MKFEIGVIINADGFSCIPLQSIQCVKANIRLLGNSLPNYCNIDLRLKPGNNCTLDYLPLLIFSYLNPKCCNISLSNPSVPLAEWITSKDILVSYFPSSALDYALSYDKKVFLIKNNCSFFPSYIALNDSACPLISATELSNLIFDFHV